MDFVARGQTHDASLECLFIEGQPIGHGAAGGNFQVFAGHLPADTGVLHFNGIVHFEGIGRNIDLAPVHFDVAMVDHLPGGRTGVGETEMINHVVQPRLQDLQHGFARDAAPLQGAFVNVAKLPFH